RDACPQLRRRRVARGPDGREPREAQPIATLPRHRRVALLISRTRPVPRCAPAVFPPSSAADAHGAVAAAAAAFPAWAALPAPARAAFFHRTADAIEARTERIGRDMPAEMGKPLREARMEAARAATILRFSAGEAWRPVGEV